MPDEPKILIADNESNILPSLEFLMKKAGYDIYIARNGSEAMEILGKQYAYPRGARHYDARYR